MEWLRQPDDPYTGCHMFTCGHFRVLVAGPGTAEYRETGRWHISISHPSRYPEWDVIKSARYSLVPNEINMAMYLPPAEEFINVHKNCFHLHECRC